MKKTMKFLSRFREPMGDGRKTLTTRPVKPQPVTIKTMGRELVRNENKNFLLDFLPQHLDLPYKVGDKVVAVFDDGKGPIKIRIQKVITSRIKEITQRILVEEGMGGKESFFSEMLYEFQGIWDSIYAENGPRGPRGPLRFEKNPIVVRYKFKTIGGKK